MSLLFLYCVTFNEAESIISLIFWLIFLTNGLPNKGFNYYYKWQIH